MTNRSALTAQVAQSVEQGIENPRVGSSILSLGTSMLDSTGSDQLFSLSKAR